MKSIPIFSDNLCDPPFCFVLTHDKGGGVFPRLMYLMCRLTGEVTSAAGSINISYISQDVV